MSDELAARRSVSGTPVFLVSGGTGQIGFELVRQLAALGTVVAPPRSEMNLERPETIRAQVRRVRPTVIVNAAAYTAVDMAESDRGRCFAANAEAPGILAEEALRVRAALIHYSTDYVFDGAKASPYVETDLPAPLNVYGESKLAGERAIEEIGGTWLVLRTSWVYGWRGNNFLRTMLRLSREREELRVVDDQIGTPTWSRSIAAATARIVALLLTAPNGDSRDFASGVYHLAAAGRTSWFGFAQAILAEDPRKWEQRSHHLQAIRTDEYPTAAARPRWSVLGSATIGQRFGIVMEPWRSGLQRALAVGDQVKRIRSRGESANVQ